MEHYYILFDNHTDAMEMYNTLKGEGMYAQISPTPRELSVCCGVALLIHEDEQDAVRKLADERDLRFRSIEGLNNTFDSGRHKYV
jgi:hypothetical protein